MACTLKAFIPSEDRGGYSLHDQQCAIALFCSCQSMHFYKSPLTDCGPLRAYASLGSGVELLEQKHGSLDCGEEVVQNMRCAVEPAG